LIVMDADFPVARSLAVTWRIPSASILKVTSIWGTPRGAGGMPERTNPAQGFIVRGHLPLALNDVDLHRGLEILRCSKGFCALYRNGGVPLDDGGGDSTEGFDGEGERRDVQKDDLLHFAGEDGGLDGRAYRHHLIGVDVFVDLGPAEFLGHKLLDPRDPRGSAHQHHLIDVLGLELGRGQGVVHNLHRPQKEIVDHGDELGAGEGALEVLGPAGIHGDVRKGNPRLQARGKLLLCLFGGVPQPLHGLRIAAEVNPRFLFELLDEPVHDPAVEVITAKLGVSIRGDDLENALADLEDGDVEGPAAEVVDEDFLFALFVEAVGQGRSGGLVDDAEDLKARDGSRVLRGLALEVVEISRAGDDRFLDFLCPKALLRRA
jgi:hypothetical protein